MLTLANKINDPIQEPYLCYRNVSKRDILSPSDPYHRHDNAFEIYLFLGGNMKLYIEQSCFLCKPGEMYLISPEQFHTVVCNGECEYDRLIINIKEDLVKKLSYEDVYLGECFKLESLDQVKRITLGENELKQFLALYWQFQEMRTKPEFGYSLVMNAYLTQILVSINRLFLNRRPENGKNIMPPLVQSVMEYIREHLSEQITLDELSEKFFFNGKYISRCFKKHTGLTIRAYILDQRIAMAKKLLANGCNVSESCYKSGFSDYANFIRSFTNAVGISPGKYSRQINE